MKNGSYKSICVFAIGVVLKETFDLGILCKFYMIGCLDFALHIVYTIVHPLLGLIKSLGSHGSLSLHFVMKVMMVSHFYE
jgi:hypothetical protein